MLALLRAILPGSLRRHASRSAPAPVEKPETGLPALPPRERDLHLVFGVRAADAGMIRASIEEAVRRRAAAEPGTPESPRAAALVMEYQGLGGLDLGCDTYSELALIPTNSEAEEAIYRDVDDHEVSLLGRLRQDYLGVPIAADIYRGIVPSPERFVQLSRAAQVLFEKGYRDVWLLLADYAYYHTCLAVEARRCGLMWESGPVALVVGTDERRYLPMPERSRCSTPADWLSRFSRIDPPAPAESCRVLVIVPSVAPAYLRNGIEVIRALQRVEPEVALFTIWRSQAEVLAQHGLTARSFDVDADYRCRDPEGLVAATEAFIRGWEEDAARRPWAGEHDGRPSFGKNTLAAYDRVLMEFEDTVTLVLRHCILIDRLDALLTEMKPSVIYKFPSGGTVCDGLLYFLARKHGIPLVSSVFLSITDSARNLDRTSHDVLAVLGEEQAEVLRRMIEVRDVVPVGQPEMDALSRDWPLDASRAYLDERLPAAAGKRLVVVATSAFDPEGELSWILDLARICAARGDCFLAVKLHPSTMPERYERLLIDNPGLPASVVTDGVVAPYLQCAALVVTDLSHAGKMAVYLGRPLLVVNTTGGGFPYNRFDEEGVALIARDRAELRARLDAMLDAGAAPAEGRAAFVARHFTRDDGRAAERTVALILRECKRCEASRPEPRRMSGG